MAEKTTYRVFCQIRRIVIDSDTGESIWTEQKDYPEFCPAEFDLLAEAETYCDDLMVGD